MLFLRLLIVFNKLLTLKLMSIMGILQISFTVIFETNRETYFLLLRRPSDWFWSILTLFILMYKLHQNTGKEIETFSDLWSLSSVVSCDRLFSPRSIASGVFSLPHLANDLIRYISGNTAE